MSQVYEIIPLNLMSAGQIARIDQVVGLANEVHRLEELGFRGGVTVEMVQTGSPCIVRLAGQKLCLRADEMVSVLVRLGADT